MWACGDEDKTMFRGVEEGREFAGCRCACRSSSYDYHVLSFIGGRHCGREKISAFVFGVFRLATMPCFLYAFEKMCNSGRLMCH